ncbi:MAG TPA: maleylpyruvate isomerase family mycothiol-dependent enzyme [Mycobacteriales bacterium]|jgi:uncharacterized protein (TIGR03083 family)|nr:maleylpyruvate isomerase family mycothiol-dependent enzyme [Mycobacteriales bacterium]
MPDYATWLAAIRGSHDRMSGLLADLSDEQIRMRSYADEWSVADVASHLGSQAEIFDLFLTAGLDGTEPPDGDVFVPIWDRWNAMPPREQVTASVQGDERLVSRLEKLTDEQESSFTLSLFGTDLDAAGFASMRLGEHALHTWDIAVALDPAAQVAPDAVELLVDTLPATAARAGQPVPGGTPVTIVTSDPLRTYAVELNPAVTLTPRDSVGPDAGVVQLPAEAFLRLVAGRLDPEHTPLGVDDPADHLDQLRQAFPGF